MRVLFLFLALSLTIITTAACGSRGPEAIGEKERVLYVALGASDAFGVGAEPVDNGYVYRIRAALDRQIDQVNLINLGIPGAEADRVADSARIFLETRARPDIVTVWTGANDVIGGRLAADFEADLRALLKRLRDDTDAYVVIANIPDLTQLPRFRARPQPTVTLDRVRAFNAAIARQAERYDVKLVDLFAQPVERALVSDVDGFHPSNAGHARIARHFLDTMLPDLGLRPTRAAGPLPALARGGV